MDAEDNVLDQNIKKRLSKITDSGLTLTNKGIKDIAKVIRSLENRWISLKETTRKITGQKENFLVLVGH